MRVLTLDGVTKYFGTKRALHELSLVVDAGERVALRGENGSGKSTVLAIASGLLDPDRGRIECSSTIGYAPEKPDMPDHLLVVEWLDVVASLKNARARDIDDPALAPLLGKRIAALSTGQRQRVSLAAALVGAPDLLVLDEPTNGLDDDARAAMIARLRQSTLLFATHDDELVTALDARVIRLRNGRRVDG